VRPTSGGDSTALRRINTVTTLRTLRIGNPPTLTELAKQSGLSRPAVESAVDDLTEAGWVAEAAPPAGERPVGRPARRFRFRAESGYVLGIDIGAYKVLACLTDLDGRQIATYRVEADQSDDRRTRLAAVRDAARRCLAEAGVDENQLWAVGLAFPGIVARDGRVLFSSLADWAGHNVAAELAADFPCPVLAENDCNVAALAERWRGAAQGSDDVVYVLSGLRTGAGLVLGGRLHRGHIGGAGETGALPHLGWARTQDHLQKFPGLADEVPAQSRAEQVFSLARSGERTALDAVDAYTADLAVGVAAIVLTIDPEVVVLGGGLWRASDLLLEPLRRHLEPLCLIMPRLEVSALGDQSVALGAVRVALTHLEERLYDPDTMLLQPPVGPHDPIAGRAGVTGVVS
jgi:predicted NBD/HSP70 family sugar kinase